MIRADGFVFATGSNEGYKLGTATVYENTVSASNGFITGTPVQVGDLESKGMAIYKASVYTVADDGTETFARPVIFDPTTGMTADGTVAQLTIAANEVAKVDYSKHGHRSRAGGGVPLRLQPAGQFPRLVHARR